MVTCVKVAISILAACGETMNLYWIVVPSSVPHQYWVSELMSETSSSLVSPQHSFLFRRVYSCLSFYLSVIIY